ncbi:MAG: MFS transporter [Spirochaetaceae bacterium]
MSEGASVLSRNERLKGRRTFLWFGVFNAASFNLLTGNLITLYLLRLGASRTVIGLIASFSFAAFFVTLLGRRLVPRFGLIRLFSLAWIFRYVLMVPAAAAPLLLLNFGAAPAIFAVGFGSLSFHFFRGLGLVANSPVTGTLSDGPDRGAFLSRFQIRIAISSTLTGLLIVLFVDPEASLARYALLLGSGILLGMVASALLATLPEPPGFGVGSKSNSLLAAILKTLREEQFRRFFLAFTVFAVTNGVYRSFLVVTAKQVYGFPDRTAYLLTVIGFLGTLTMGLMSRLLTDRIGAKPMTLLFVGVIGLGTIPLIALPPLAGLPGFLLMGALFFTVMLGITGGETTAQAYFLALTSPKERLELGLFFFIALGSGGTVGSALGGAVLDGLTLALGLGVGQAFRLFFAGSLLLLLLAFLLFSRLERMGAYSFRGALGVLFSLRDLRAINLVNRLDETESIGDGRRALQQLGATESTIATREILKALDSPSFVIRNEAIYALANVPWNEGVEEALIEELSRNEFTTANAAARMLGKRGTPKAIAPLRRALRSEDYLLRAKAAVALARLRDRESLPAIGEIVRDSDNPLVVIHAAAALRLYEERRGVRWLFLALARRELDSYVADELVIDAAALLGVGPWFYRLYGRFTRNPREAREEVLELLPAGDGDVAAALLEITEGERSVREGGDRTSAARMILVRELERVAAEGPELLRRALQGLDLDSLPFPGRLLLLLLGAKQIKQLPIE